MGGLGCTGGKLITNFTGLMTALRREIIKVEPWRAKWRWRQLWGTSTKQRWVPGKREMEWQILLIYRCLCYLQVANLGGEKGRRICLGTILVGNGMEIGVRDPLNPYPAAPVPLPCLFSLLFGSFYLMNATNTLCCTKLNTNKMQSSQIYCWFVPP